MKQDGVRPYDDRGEFEDEPFCDRCGGDGWIMAFDGDGNDWGEDTYSGPMDAMIKCRHCKGTGQR